MFHLTEGLYFEKLDKGAVRIVKKESASEGAATDWTIRIDAEQWASVIASMSDYGEESYGFYRALSFHRGDAVPASAIPTEPDLRCKWIFKDVAIPTGGEPCGLGIDHPEMRQKSLS